MLDLKIGDRVIRRYHYMGKTMMALPFIIRETKTLWVTDDGNRYYKSDGCAYGTRRDIWSGEDRIVAYDEKIYNEWFNKWRKDKLINFCIQNIDLISKAPLEDLETVCKILKALKEKTNDNSSNHS